MDEDNSEEESDVGGVDFIEAEIVSKDKTKSRENKRQRASQDTQSKLPPSKRERQKPQIEP